MGLDSQSRSVCLASIDRFIRDRLEPDTPAIDDAGEFPQALYRELANLGILALAVPRSQGGLGPDLSLMLEVLERLARSNVAFAVSVANFGDCVAPLLEGAQPHLLARLLPGLLSGEQVPAFCLSEPAGGSDVAAMTTRAVRQDGYVISGRKSWITNAPVADLFIVFAKTDPSAGHRGISAFLVSREANGLTVGGPERLLGLRASPTAEVILDEVHVPAEARLGEEGAGFKLAMTTLDESRLQIASVSVGAAARATDVAIEYARERRQFGHPIIEHQGLGFLLADMATELATARALLSTALKVFLGSEERHTRSLYAAMAKLVCSNAAMHAAINAAQVLGATGLTRAYPVERLIRDCKALQIFEGSNEIQKWLIARELARSGSAVLSGSPFSHVH